MTVIPASTRLTALGRAAFERSRRYVAPRTLAVILVISGSFWAFAKLADEMIEGETRSFDTAILLALRNPADSADPLGPAWIEELGRDVTALGGFGILVFLTVAVVGFLWLQGKRREMLFVAASVASGQLASTLFKLGFDRPSPDLVPHGAVTYTSSFPSGHAMMAAVTYLTLAALLSRDQPRRVLKAYLLAVAVIVTLAVGASRVYLGVHWPTDVLAGWTVGAAWALMCWSLADRFLPRAGRADPAPPLREPRRDP